MNTSELESNRDGFFQSQKALSLVLLTVFIIGLGGGAFLANGDSILNSDRQIFEANVDNAVGINQ